MDVYNLGKVDMIFDPRDDVYFGFNIIGVHGQPLVTFSFETRKEADEAHRTMQVIIAKVKTITPHPER